MIWAQLRMGLKLWISYERTYRRDALGVWWRFVYFRASIDILDYAQQILLQGTEASAISTMTLRACGSVCHGVAEHRDTVRANFEAILDAVGRAGLGAKATTRATPLARTRPTGRST
jgi:uncharacterized ferredoxin-like protein